MLVSGGKLYLGGRAQWVTSITDWSGEEGAAEIS